MERLCHFLGKELDEAAITSVVENTSFEAMRRNDMCNSTMLPKEFMDQEKGTFLRKGEACSSSFFRSFIGDGEEGAWQTDHG